MTFKNIENEQRGFEERLAGEDGSEKSKLLKEQNRYRDRIIGKMKDIKEHSRAETTELAAEMEALPEYPKMFKGLQKTTYRVTKKIQR